MPYWTALTWHIWMRIQFKTKISRTNIFGFINEDLKCSDIIEENAYLKIYSTIQQGSHKLGFIAIYSNVRMHFRIML